MNTAQLTIPALIAGQQQQLQPLESHYSIRADYVVIAIVFFCLGFFIAYKTATNMAKSISFITNHPIK